jgi:hypothetical protein
MSLPRGQARLPVDAVATAASSAASAGASLSATHGPTTESCANAKPEISPPSSSTTSPHRPSFRHPVPTSLAVEQPHRIVVDEPDPSVEGRTGIRRVEQRCAAASRIDQRQQPVHDRAPDPASLNVLQYTNEADVGERAVVDRAARPDGPYAASRICFATSNSSSRISRKLDGHRSRAYEQDRMRQKPSRRRSHGAV